MTFFQRIKTPFTESPTEEQARLQPRMRLVGEALQERREDLGLDLDEVGAMLRIKPAYLAALEQGRTHDLPGPTYAIGFVRAYAEFLGLDTDAVLARFKAEAAGVTARPDLTLPVPLGERSLPGGALVLVALIVALCGYGIWYYLSTEERNRPERVAAVPASLQPLPAPAASPASGDTNPSAQPPPSLYGAAAVPSVSAAPSTAPTQPAAAPQPTSPAPTTASAQTPASTSPASSQPAGPGASLAPGALLMPIPRSPATTAPVPPPPAPAVTPQPAAPGQPAAPSLTVAPRQPVPPPQTASAAAGPVPPQSALPPQAAARQPAPPEQITAATPAPAVPSRPAANATASAGKITIKALNDCWIQVRAADQSIVFSRVLKSGEVYAVPPRSGLLLRTGNAGALEIAVDGKTAPSIGGVGALRRDVLLDPAELAAGTAVHG